MSNQIVDILGFVGMLQNVNVYLNGNQVIKTISLTLSSQKTNKLKQNNGNIYFEFVPIFYRGTSEKKYWSLMFAVADFLLHKTKIGTRSLERF